MIGFDIDGVLAHPFDIFDDKLEAMCGERLFENTKSWFLDLDSVGLKNLDFNFFLSSTLIEAGNTVPIYASCNFYIEKLWNQVVSPAKYPFIPIISSRDKTVRRTTEKWLDKYIRPTVPCKLYISNEKEKIIKELKLKYFVEDRYESCKKISSVCKVFMMNQPWNLEREVPNYNVVRINDMKELYDEVKKDMYKLPK